jgi:hypothetical protein
MSPSRHDLPELKGVRRDTLGSVRARPGSWEDGSARDEVLRQEPQLNGLTDELSNVSDFETMHQVEAMYLDSPHADSKFLCNLPIRQTLNDERKHLLLPRCHGTRSVGDP